MNVNPLGFIARRVAVFIALLASCGSAFAHDWTDGFNLRKKEGDRYKLIFSPATHHFTPSDEHTHVWLIGIDRERTDGSLAGIAYFRNSFGQPSAYIFPWGRVYRHLLGQPGLYAKLSAGLLYGYRGEYEDKVPYNHNGFSPGIVPSMGWESRGGYQAQVNLLGTAGVMFQISLPLN